MEMKIAEGLTKAAGDMAGKEAAAGGLSVGHQAPMNDVQAFQQHMQSGANGSPQSAELSQQGLRPADGTGPPGGAHDRATSFLTDMQKHVDSPHEQIYAYMKELGQKPDLSAVDIMSLTSKVNMLGIATQAQMNVVKKTTQNMQTFLRNQG
jgi:hypothetical protein